MSKRFFAAAFALGLAAVAWVGFGFIGSSWLALAMTLAIAGVYLLGGYELRQYRAATAALSHALADIPQPLPDLAAWLERVPASLRHAVRLRIAGERAPLPGPALTPYLVGLLVMLGMLGTFLGMVVTFKGAVFALEGSTDLQAIRSALAAPIKGLGLSFGTSVAGVAASAMLGLMATIARRERLELGRQLEGRIATVLLPFSLAHQRQATYQAIQSQARALPDLVERMEAMMERIEQRSRQLDEQLSARQAKFHEDVRLAYTELAGRVGTSLQDSLAEGARAAGDSIRPVVASTMAQLAQDAQRMQERLGEVAQAQVDTLSAQFGATARGVSDQWTAALEQQARGEQQRQQAWTQALQGMAVELQAQWRRAADEAIAQQQAVCRTLEQSAGEVAERAGAQALRTLDEASRLLARSEELVRARTENEARWQALQGERMEQLATLWRTELAALREQEGERGRAAVDRLDQLQAAVAQHLATLGAALEAPITRLLHTASEVPQAAAGVIAQLREEMSRAGERDNLALQERTGLMERLGALLQALQQASGEQREAIDTMVASASAVLQQAGERWGQALEAQAGKAADTSAHLATSALELGSLAEGFAQAVQSFQAGNDKLAETLQRVEASLQRSTARSDEQLAYYVAQAREVIDLSIASQQGLVDNLRQLQARKGEPLPVADAEPA
ncbi:hypothetical protein GCM10028796_56170 [Ramlibacter monticola]|uniref:DUF802 domain-containing protein n=1 Tax=Ramlibacter monticola TaxID=1926872 RepID=A0A936ZCM7_9BURK|nr:hypothetical protein [Ramlibacter monticola]MBL0395140.1 hypothetical protein [Ramlibacter monticola]